MDDELGKKFWDFVNAHINDNPSQLRLKYHGKEQPQGISIDKAITQIECRRKFNKKLSQTLRDNPHFIFPSVLSGEQATSDLLADYHANIVAGLAKTEVPHSPLKIVDFTAGLGIDALHFLHSGDSVMAIDIDEDKVKDLLLNSDNQIQAVHADSTQMVADLALAHEKFDVAFIDPARRGNEGLRVFALSDCQPNVIGLMDKLDKICNFLIVKASPMLDISNIAQSLKGISKIIVLGTPTECKELIAVCAFVESNNVSLADLPIQATTLLPEPLDFSFTIQTERNAQATYSIPREGSYLYEPYPSVMKAGPFNLLAQRFGAYKIHPNTHLYWSENENEEFPGNCMEIIKVIPYQSKFIKRLKKEFPALQVAVRNFDLTAEALRQKLGVKEGNQYRLYGVTLANSTPALIITKV